MILAELKNIQQDNNKDCSRSKLSRLCYLTLFHMIQHENYFVIAREKQSNCTIFAQACVEDLIFLLKWLILMFHFCVSTVSISECVINKRKPSFMQIFVYLISFVRGMQDVYQTCSIKIWRKRRFKIRTLLFRNLFQWS